jgi:hypothetical protein
MIGDLPNGNKSLNPMTTLKPGEIYTAPLEAETKG